MSDVSLMPREDVERMFARMGEAMPDTSVIRRKFLNCPYGEDKRQAVDIYLPDEGSGPFPAVLFLHGGAWAGGSRSDAQMAPFIKGVARGYAFVSVGYRLTPRVRWPENLFDVKAALRWLRANAETYLIDANRVVIAGASAGAQLALMAAYTQRVPVYEGDRLDYAKLGADYTCEIKAVVDQFGPVNFLTTDAQFDESGYPRIGYDESEPPSADVMFGAGVNQAPNLVRFMNPVDSVHPGIPPTLILHGRYDPAVPYQQSVELHERIRAVCGEGQSVLYIDEHALHADPVFAEQKWTDVIFRFLDGILTE